MIKKLTRQVYNGPRVVKFIRNQKIIFSKKWFLKIMIKNLINYAKSILNYACYKHNLHWFGAYDLMLEFKLHSGRAFTHLRLSRLTES